MLTKCLSYDQIYFTSFIFIHKFVCWMIYNLIKAVSVCMETN